MERYNNRTHIYGRFWVITALVGFIMIPLAISAHLDAWPSAAAVFKGLAPIALAAAIVSIVGALYPSDEEDYMRKVFAAVTGVGFLLACAPVMAQDLGDVKSKFASVSGIVQEKCMAFIRDHADVIVLHDQDVLNVVCRDHLSYLDKTWDAQACETRQGRLSGFNDIARTANIIHFIGGRKPWHPGCRHPFRKEYFRYLRLTPYRDFVWEYRKAWLRYLLWHTRYSHGRRRWYLLGVRIWQKKD